MAEPRDDVPYNPYQSQTTANTNPAWLDAGQKNIDADIDGMADYANNMKTIMTNLGGHVGELNLLATLPNQAWAPGALPEGAYTAHMMMSNFNELQQYLSYLQQSLYNIGAAAQTIASAYAGTDGWSAADLNAVRFAYGEDVRRPSGYPKAWLDQVKTYQEQLSENMRTGNAAASGVVVSWTDQGTTTDSAGNVHQVAVSTDGVRREIITSTDRFTGLTTTTTIVTYPPNPNGKTAEEKAGYARTTRQTSSTHLASGNTVETTTTTYGADNQVTGTQTRSTTYTDGEVTAQSTQNYDPDHKKTTGTSTVTNTDGSQTVTTTQGETVDRTVQIGQQTDGIVGIGDQPAQDKINELRPR